MLGATDFANPKHYAVSIQDVIVELNDGGIKRHSQLPGGLEQYMKGEIKVDEMVTHSTSSEVINRAFNLMHGGESTRSVVLFD